MSERTHRKSAGAALPAESKARKIVQSVRRLDCGTKLEEREAVSVALEQGADFIRWLQSGASIGRVEVWVGGFMLITASQKESWAELNLFGFDLKRLGVSLSEAVMQLVNVTPDDERVVLLSFPLVDVPANGLNEVKHLPDGRTIGLAIKQPEAARFKVTVAFDSAAAEFVNSSAGEEPMTEPARALVASASGSLSFRALCKRVVAPLSNPGLSFSRVYSTALGSTVGGLLVLGLAGWWINARVLDRRTSSPTTLNSGNVVRPEQPSKQSSDLGNAAPLSSTTSKAPKPKRNSTASVASNGPSKDAEKHPPPLATTSQGAEQSAEKAAGAIVPLIAQAESGTRVNERPKTPSSSDPWDVKRSEKLAAIKVVYLHVHGSLSVDSAELQVLRNSFGKILGEHVDNLTIVSESEKNKADSIINLYFQADSDCLGVVFLDILDGDGTTWWRDDASCKSVPRGEPAQVFADVSALLLNRMREAALIASRTVPLQPRVSEQVSAVCEQTVCSSRGRQMQLLLRGRSTTRYVRPK